MTDKAQTTVKPDAQPSLNVDRSGLLQRKCECGNAVGLAGACGGCQSQRLVGVGGGGAQPGAGPVLHDLVQTKLVVGAVGDKYEQEADRVAEAVMRMPGPQLSTSSLMARSTVHLTIQRLNRGDIEPLQRQEIKDEEDEEEKANSTVQTKLLTGTSILSISSLSRGGLQRQAEAEDLEKKWEEEEATVQAKGQVGRAPQVPPDLETRLQANQGKGQPLPEQTRSFMESRFGHDFSQVRIHTDAEAAQLNRGLNAKAFTHRQDVYFGAGKYNLGSHEGKRLLAHELTHVVQQGGQHDHQTPLSSVNGEFLIQRTLGDGHDLTSPRFTRLLDLEAAYDGERIIRIGSSGRGVQAIQQALYDLGYSLRNYGADGDFGNETRAAVKAFQRAQVPPLVDDGEIGPLTMAALNARFSALVLPAPAARSAPWDADSPSYTCIRSTLCPWSPHTIDVLRTRITLKSFDSISWADEEWDGTAWIPARFPGGGYNTGTEIGVLNSSCEEMAETLYHEVLHAEQPTTHRTTRERESYAYRIGEEFSIAMGLGGRPSLRSTDAQGREYADRTKVEAFVATAYPSVPAGGSRDEIIGKAVTHGHVRVQRPDRSIYTRPAAVGEKVPGPITLVNEVTHTTSGWTCP